MHGRPDICTFSQPSRKRNDWKFKRRWKCDVMKDLRNTAVKVRAMFIWLRTGSCGGLFEHKDEILSSIKAGTLPIRRAI
jgi:hypothetical protein